MKRLLFVLVAAVAVVIAILLFAPNAIPVAAYKSRIETAASESVGRAVTIGDNLSFRIFPRTAFHVEDLAVANADGFDGDYLARVGEADVGVRLIPLLSGSVEVDRFVLTEPDINLARAADGRVNWNLAGDAPVRADAPAAGGPGGREFRDVRLGDVRIIDGRARYADAAAGKTYLAEDIDLKIVLKSFREPLEVDGTMAFQGQPTTVDLVLTTLEDILRGAPSNLKLDVKVGETAAGADLTLETGEETRYRGPVDLNAPDLPAFAALVGTELADAPGFDRLSLAGEVDGGANALRLSNARIGFDDINAEGALTLDWSGARPKAGGVLSTDKLDLRPYLPPPATSAEGFPAWSEEPMDLTSLNNIDADFDISTDAIFLNDLEIGESRLKLRIDNGRMTADIPELAMYGGQGSGRLVVNARGATPSFSGNFDMSAVEAQPLSLDLLKHDNLLGLGSLNFNFTAAGASQAAIMSSLDGEGGFDIADGALKGVDIPKIARTLAALREGFNPAALQNAVSLARGPREETDFSEFLSDFKITDGLVNAPTITLNGPFVTMSGGGTVNLPAQTIDLRLSPRASTTADGEGGRTIMIPLRVGGTFAKPTFAIDHEAFLRSGVERTLRGLLGGAAQGQDGAGTAEAAPEDTARRALEDFLGGAKNDQPENKPEGAEPEGAEQESGAEPEPEPSLEETLVKKGLGAIFKRKEEPPADEDEKDSGDQEQ